MSYYLHKSSVLGIYVKLGTRECFVEHAGDDGCPSVYWEMSHRDAFLEKFGDELVINVEHAYVAHSLPTEFIPVVLNQVSIDQLFDAYNK
jgi:predicted acetyltransferase